MQQHIKQIFLMLKVTDKWNEIPKFALMWNMKSMVLIGFCEQDYKERAALALKMLNQLKDGDVEKRM